MRRPDCGSVLSRLSEGKYAPLLTVHSENAAAPGGCDARSRQTLRSGLIRLCLLDDLAMIVIVDLFDHVIGVHRLDVLDVEPQELGIKQQLVLSNEAHLGVLV